MSRPRRSLRRPACAALAAAAVLLAACGGDDEASPTASTEPAGTTTTETAPATSTATAPAGIDPLTGAGVDPVVVKGTNDEVALLAGVRAARHEGFDRVVFEFGNALPGYDVRYVRPPVVQDGSGKPVAVEGAYVVRVRMETAMDADLSQPDAPRTYRGPGRISPGTPEVAELASAGGFEAVLTWAIGLRDRVDFRVTTLTGPPRLVIDFRNH